MNPIVQMIIFSLIFSSIIGSIHYYIWLNVAKRTGLSAKPKRVLTVLIVFLFASIPATFFIHHKLPFAVSKHLTFFPYTWMGMMFLLFSIFILADLTRLMYLVYRRTLGKRDTQPTDPAKRASMQRIFAGTCGMAVTGITGAGVYNAMRIPTVKTVPIKFKRAHRRLSGLKVVQISDLHIGITVGKDWLTDVVNRINALQPHLVVITGDLIDSEIHKANEIQPLKDIRSTHGTYFVTGNHEYYSDVKAWLPIIESLGIRVLRNESIEIETNAGAINLAGVYDYNAARIEPSHAPDIPRAMESAHPELATVLLAHQPKAVIEAATHNVDLVLSGHTHGGQIFPFSLLVGLQQPYNKGLYRHSDTTQIYVNQGTFLWGPPMRVGTECEITELILS